ncbi:MAG: YbaB/EbfC family nucleoid-associated protein, partial [Oscillospiraceae bacterium]|nr:YbaB/EbfC family nucleoid-associated protein [Oscillospiraceae bacterium]
MKSRVPKQFQGGGQDMNSMIHQARKMQDQITALQEDIEQRTFSASAGGGAVNVTVTGKKTLQAIELKPEVVDASDIEMIQDLIISAV